MVDNTPPIETHVATDESDIPLNPTTWNTLLISSNTNTIFQTYEWFKAWWDTFGDQGQLQFITWFKDHVPIGFAPLMRRPSARGDRIVLVGESHADYADLVITQEHTKLAQSLLHSLQDHPSAWRSLDLKNIPSSSPSMDTLSRIGRSEGLHVLPGRTISCPTLQILGQENHALSLIQRYSVRRPHNYLSRRGRLRVRCISDPEEIQAHLDIFFDQHISRWSRTSTPSLFLNPKNRDFYRRLACLLNPKEWLLFSVAEFDGKPIAFHFGFDYGGRIVWYKPAFSPAFARRSPGLLIIRHLIEYALANRRTEVDFTVGEEAFKARFTNAVRVNQDVRIFRRRLDYLEALGIRRARAAGRRLLNTFSG